MTNHPRSQRAKLSKDDKAVLAMYGFKKLPRGYQFQSDGRGERCIVKKEAGR